jgi:hypothetical protein
LLSFLREAEQSLVGTYWRLYQPCRAVSSLPTSPSHKPVSYLLALQVYGLAMMTANSISASQQVAHPRFRQEKLSR